MALRYFDGFEHSHAGVPGLGSDRCVAGIGRNGSAGLHMDGGTYGVTMPLFDLILDGATMYVGFAVQHNGTQDDGFDMFRVYNEAGQTVWRIRTPLANTFQFFSSAFQGATFAKTSGGYEYWEFEVVMDSSAGEFRFWREGVLEVEATAINTRAAAGNIDRVQFASDALDIEFYADDLYVCDNTGTVNNGRLGDVHVVALNPSGAGTHSDGVGSDADSVDNHLLIDDGLSMSNVDYVGLVPSDRESFNVPNLGDGVLPLGVCVLAQAQNGNGMTTAIDGFIRLGATDYDAASPGLVSNVGPAQYRWGWGIDPSTAAAWVEDGLDGVEGGVRRTA